MTSTHAIRRVVTVVLLTVAASALALAGRASATPPDRTYLQVNICGNACNGGRLTVVAALAHSIRRATPFAVTLNEVCENQYRWLSGHLPAYHGRFDPTGPTCRNGARYGNAVLARTPRVARLGSWPLPSPAGGEPRRLMCVRTPDLVVCATHISYVAGNLAVQVEAVARILRGLARAGAVLLGGDFNADPGDRRMDPLYGACLGPGAGGFREADAGGCAGRSTLDRRVGSDVLNENTLAHHKIDYVFLSAAADVRADAMDTVDGLSDHDGLWATVHNG